MAAQGKPIHLTSSGGNSTVSGTLITATSAAETPGTLQAANFRNKTVMFTLTIPNAGVGTVLERASINSIDAVIRVQDNIAGSMVAIVSATVPFMSQDRNYTLRATLSASGAVGARFNCNVTAGFASPDPIDAQSATVAIDTTRTVSLKSRTNGFVTAAAVNDVATANQCTWTGTVTVVETGDATAGTFRVSIAEDGTPTSGESQTAIATFDVTSVAGLCLAAASWR